MGGAHLQATGKGGQRSASAGDSLQEGESGSRPQATGKGGERSGTQAGREEGGASAGDRREEDRRW